MITKEVSDSMSVEFANLNPGTTYNLSVSAIAKIQQHKVSEDESSATTKSSPAYLKLVTLPSPPPAPTMVKVSFHYSMINWSPPSRVAPEAVIQDYLVKYATMNNLGSKIISGTDMVQSSLNRTSITLKDLIQGTTYSVQVKVITCFYVSKMK